MDISYLKKYEPLFGDYQVKKKLGEGGSGAVFEIEREDFGQTYSAAVKAIRIPNDTDVIDTLKLQGDDPSQYCYKMAESIRAEVETMSKLKGNSNIVSYENHKTIPHQDGIGWDILIKMELLTPLLKYLQDKTVDEKMVIRIGIDMCRALEFCHRAGVIHRDIKPSNIFYSEQGTFKLGDFGVSKISMEDNFGTKVGTLPYMAPEVFNGEVYEKNIDIYSLGLVLYMLANNYLLPFEEKGSNSAARTIAQSKRTAGMPLPKPANAGIELTKVILKASAFKPQVRYQNATDMRKALEACLNEDNAKPKAAPVQKSTPVQKSASVQKSAPAPVKPVASGKAVAPLKQPPAKPVGPVKPVGPLKQPPVKPVQPQGSAHQQGAYTYNSAGMNRQPPEHGKAVASLILGIVGLCCCGICGIIGLVMAMQAKEAGNQEGICKAGFILGIVAIVLWAIGIIITFASELNTM